MTEGKNIKSELIPKIATGFCAGISRTCGICGAVSGAIMAIGLFKGRSLPDESVETSYSMVRGLIDMFESRFGSTSCRELTGCDLGTKEGQRAFKSNNLIERCKDFVEEAARMAVSTIEASP